MFDANPRVGLLALAKKYQASLDKGEILAPAKSLDQMSALIFNNQLDAGLTVLFMLITVSIVVFGLRTALRPERTLSQPPTKYPTSRYQVLQHKANR